MRFYFLALLVTIFFASDLSINAQVLEARISGTVFDQEKFLVTSAEVKAINRNGKIFETLTNDEGFYVLNLPLGEYTFEFHKDGFKRVRVINYIVNSPTQMVFDLILEPGQCSDCNGDIYGEGNKKQEKIKIIDFTKKPKQKKKKGH